MSSSGSAGLNDTLNSTGRFNVSQSMAQMARRSGVSAGGLASAVVAAPTGGAGGINKQILSVLSVGKSGAAKPSGAPTAGTNVDLMVEYRGNAKHKKAAQHKFLMTCQQPPVTLKWYPQTATGVVQHVEILLDLRDAPTPEAHQHRFEVSADEDGEYIVPSHMGRPNQPLFIAVNMYSAGESGYDVLGYELEVRTGSWNSAGAPIDNCGRWVNTNGHAFIGIWRDGKPHTGKGAWSATMRGKGEATLAVMQGEWRGGGGSGTLTTGPDAGRVGLDPSRDSTKEKRPWEVDRDNDNEQNHEDLEIYQFTGDWDEQNMPKTGKGDWMSQSRHLYSGVWNDYLGTGAVKASKRAGKQATDFDDHVDLPTFTGEWLEEKPWGGQGTWYDADDNAFTGTIKEGKAFTGKGKWQLSETLDDGETRKLELLEGFWWKGFKLEEAYIEKAERSTVKANRPVEHYFDVTSQQGPLTITLTPIQMTGSFKSLDLLVSTVGVPDMSSFQYRQECSIDKGGKIELEHECFHPARFYVKVIVNGSKGKASTTSMYDFLQYIIDFRTGSWKASTRAVKDEFGRNRWEVPDSNDGSWVAPDGTEFHGVFRHGLPLHGTGSWTSECGNTYEGTWEHGKGSGKIMGPNEEVYEGDWLESWPTHGKGTFTGDDGNTYIPDEGEWKGGAGEGSIVHKTGATFWGAWDGRDPVEGRGKWFNKRGQVFEGNWSEGVGMGMISSDDGEVVFEGEWRGETPFKGKGSWRDVDGNVYEGDWRNGILYGKDLSQLNKLSVGNDLSKITVDADGNNKSGAAVGEAQAQRKPVLTAAVKPKAGHRLVTGRRFEGEWRDGKPWTGLGMFRGQMGHVFDGTWKKGRPFEGKGQWMSEEGWLIDGEIRNGRVVQAKGKWRCTLPIEYSDGPHEDFDGRVFEGEYKDGVPFGGKGEWWDGHNHIYKGEWAAMEGAGTIEMLDISAVTTSGEYIGKWRGGLPLSGEGVWVDLDGYTFTGSWNNALPYTGHGEWNYAVNLYNGKWEEGKGAGRITGESGSRYKGTWRAWRPWVGQGEYVDPEGNRYTGDYKDGAPWNGTGAWKSEDGHVYRGDLRNGQPWNGEGRFKDLRRNCVYEGRWVESNGQGNIYGEGDEVYHGTWRNGIPHTGKGSWRSIHMKVFNGEWEDGEGAGTITGLKKKERFEGAWMEGDGAPVTGAGRWLSEEGFMNTYEGDWKDTRGTGRITGAEGQIYKGDWWSLAPYKGKGVFRGPDGFDFQGAWKDGTRTWRGRKWQDSEATKPDFKIHRSRFLAGRQTAAIRAREATDMAAEFAGGENKKSKDQSIAAALLRDAEQQQPLAIENAGTDSAGDKDGDETDVETQRKLDALQLALDCGALSEQDFKRAKARIMGSDDLAVDPDPGAHDPGAQVDDSEARELEKIRSVATRSRRTANPWTENMEYCPPSVEPSAEEKVESASPKNRRNNARQTLAPIIDSPKHSSRSSSSSKSSSASSPVASSDEDNIAVDPPSAIHCEEAPHLHLTFDESSLISKSRRSKFDASSPTSARSLSPKLRNASTTVSPNAPSPKLSSSEPRQGGQVRRWGEPIPAHGKQAVQLRSAAAQARHDEMQWESEANSWMKQNKDQVYTPAVRDASFERPGSVQLRYLRRQASSLESDLPAVNTEAIAKRRGSRSSSPLESEPEREPEPEPGPLHAEVVVEGRRTRGSSAPSSTPQSEDLFAVEGLRKKRTATPPLSTLPAAAIDLFAAAAQPQPLVSALEQRGVSPSILATNKSLARDSQPASLYSSADEFTLVVTCEDEGLVRGAHKLRLRAHSLTAVLAEIKAQLGIAKEEAATHLGLYVMDPEFDEYIVLKSIEDLPTRAKVRLVHRPPSRRGSAASTRIDPHGLAEPNAKDQDKEEQEAIQLELLAARTASEKSQLRDAKKKKRSTKTSTSLAELRAVRSRLLESDPGMAMSLGSQNKEHRQVFAESGRGALHAIETLQDSNTQQIKERNMLRKLQGRKKMAGVRAMVLVEEEERALIDGGQSGSSVEPLPMIDPRMIPRFEGEWADDMPYQGKGRWLSPDGHLYAGTWVEGHPQDGDGAWADTRGHVFDGKWKGGRPFHGEGEFSNDKGYVWSGRWKHGQGFGSITFAHKGEELGRFDGKWTAGDGPPHTGVGSWVDARIGSGPALDNSGDPLAQVEGKKQADAEEPVRASHILVKFDQSARLSSWRDPDGTETRQRSRADAMTVLNRLRDQLLQLGGQQRVDRFAELAQEVSDCGSARDGGGGDLGELVLSEMDSEIAAVFEDGLEVGEVSEVVETDSGLHIVLRTEPEQPRRSLHTKVLPPIEDTLDISRRCQGEWRNGELVNGSGQWRSPLTMWQFDGEWTDGQGWGTYRKPGADTRAVPGRWAGGMPLHHGDSNDKP